MKQSTLTVIIIFYYLNAALGQGKTYFGIEFSSANDIYKITDNGNYLMNVPLGNAAGGFHVRQELNKNLFN
jgi:hypothetical protein